MTSALFLVLLLRRCDRRGQSVWIGLLKMLETLGTSIPRYLYHPTTTALDALYVGLPVRAPRRRRPPP